MAQLKVLDDPLVQKNYSSVDGCHIGVQIADTVKQTAYILVQQDYTSVEMCDTHGYKLQMACTLERHWYRQLAICADRWLAHLN